MKDLPLSFKLTCNYCYRTLPEQMTVCKCGSTVCPTHTNYHFVSKHTPAFFLIKGEEIKVYSDNLTQQECDMISQYINTNLLPCKHLNNIPKEKVSFLPNCEDCDIKENLYCCLICGYTGCPREQYGSDGRGHALKHSLEKEHCVSVNLSREVFCYECNKFVKFDAKSKVNFKNRESKNHLAKEIELNKDGCTLETSSKAEPVTLADISTESSELETRYVGIDNLGNTCFISSVMQLLSIVTQELNLEEHFVACNKLPLQCLICQSVRVLVSLQKGKKIPIDEFVDLIYNEETFVIFQRNFQQDASEFFIFFWNYLKENLPLKVMDLETVTVMECECTNCKNDSCKKKKQRVESFFLFVPCENTLSDSLEKSFDSEEKMCPCDKKLVIKNYIRILPDYLVLIVNRWLNDGNKNNKVIECDNLNLSNVFYQTIPHQKEILVYEPEKIRKAMILEDNDEEKATNRLLKDDLHLREDLDYKLVGAICHKGETITSGHYVFVVKDDQVIVLDDEEVKFGDEEWFKKAYIVLYK